jgi:hypothetical protein
MADDWRIRIELERDGDAGGPLDRLGFDLGAEARERARELEQRRLAVSRDGNELFVYAGSYPEALRALAVIEAELREQDAKATTSRIEHWLEDEERWDDEPRAETWEEEQLAEGYAPWEVRVQCASRGEAHALAERLEQEGYSVTRRFRYLIAGVASQEEAEALAARVHGEVEPGGEPVWETAPDNPFAVFGGMGG